MHIPAASDLSTGDQPRDPLPPDLGFHMPASPLHPEPLCSRVLHGGKVFDLKALRLSRALLSQHPGHNRSASNNIENCVARAGDIAHLVVLASHT